MMDLLKLILFYFAFISSLTAQSDNIQTWTDYTTNNWINTEWLYNGDYGIRGAITIDEWTQFYINPAFLFRKSDELTYHGGLRSVFTSNLEISNTLELRPWQGVRYIWPRLNKIYFDHYLRAEERFIWPTEESGFDFSLRARYRIRLRTLDFSLPLIPTRFTSAASFEAFFDFNDVIFEPYVGSHRFTFVLGNYVAKDLIIEIHYILQRSRKDEYSESESYDNIFRLRVKHNVAKGILFN